MGVLYKLDFRSGKSYIGMTERTHGCRLKEHNNEARKGNKHLLYCAWRKFGRPKLCVLAYVENHMLMETERRAVLVFSTMIPNGYNMTPGGEHPPMFGKKHSKDAKKKMSLAKMGKNNPNKRPEMRALHSALWKGENNPAKRPEVRAKISASLTGKKRPDITGKKHFMHRSEIAAKVSMAMRGENNPMKRPELRAHMRELGLAMPAETRAKISATLLGRKPSVETRAKMSVSATSGWNKRRGQYL